MRVLIAGGGTGGHLYPGIAIAEEVMRRPGGQVLFVGTARGLESKLVPAEGFPLELLEVSGLNRVGAGRFVKGMLRLPKAFFASRAILKKFRPDLVVGVGGYASGPLVLTAALLGYRTAIQEQNSHAGFTNRVLGRFVGRVFTAFEDAGRSFPAAKIRLLGNPVRRRFLDRSLQGDAQRDHQPRGTAPRAGDGAAAGAALPLLVVGGSQGARAVNDLVVGAMAELRREAGPQGVAGAAGLPRLLHQTGPADEARVRGRYAELGLSAAVEVRSFIDDMPGTLADAALVVGRAGALTLAELAIVGRPAILIPLPTAAGDHQSRNAAEFARAGAAVVADQRTTTAEALARLIAQLGADSARRAAMSRAMAQLGRPSAAPDIVDELEQYVGAGSPDAVATAGAPR